MSAAILALLSVVNANLAALNELVKTVIASQSPEVQRQLWERHMTLSQPIYDVTVKLLQKLDPALVDQVTK